MEELNFRLACGLYEQIELWSMRKTPVKVVYKEEDGSIKELKGILTDVYVKNKLEFIQINKIHEIMTYSIEMINPDVMF